MSPAKRLLKIDFVLLAMIAFFLGIGWPIMKIALSEIGPWTFRKPNKWIARLSFWEANTTPPVVCCNVFFEGTSFPATVTYTCDPATADPVTATVTIGTPRVFP